MSPEAKREIVARITESLKRAKFRQVVRNGDDLYWRHKDGRTVIRTTDADGEPAIKRLDK